MAPRLTQSRERIIWGEQTHRGVSVPHGNNAQDLNEFTNINDHDALEIQEILPPPEYRRHSHPGRVMSGSERVAVSLNKQFSSPSNSFVTPRRRPHGPDAGKSIHKAAEAPQISPLPSTFQAAPRRRSLGSTKRMTPAPPPSDPSNADMDPSFPAGLVQGVPRKWVATLVSPSRKRKVRNTVGGGVSSRSAPVVAAGPDRLPSPSGPTASNRGVHQVARKSISRMVSKNSIPDRPMVPIPKPRAMLATKAARKTSVFESCSDNDSDERSSLSYTTSISGHTLSAEDPLGEKYKERKHASSDKAEPVSGDSSSNSPAAHPDVRAAVQRLDKSDGSVREESISVELPSSHYSSPTRSGSTDSIIPAVLTASHSSPIQHSPSRSVTRAFGTRSGRSPPIDPDGMAAPPTALLAAFENLSAYTLHLQRIKKLPFLLRNVRTSFRARCRELNIPCDIDPLSFSEHLSHVPLTYQYASPSDELYTYETTTGERECPICSIFGMFPSWEALRKHVLWDHGEIEIEITLNELVEGGVSSIIVRKNEAIRARNSSQVSVQQLNKERSIDLIIFDDFLASLSSATSPPPSFDKTHGKNKEVSSDISALVPPPPFSHGYPEQTSGDVSSLVPSLRDPNDRPVKLEESTSKTTPSDETESGNQLPAPQLDTDCLVPGASRSSSPVDQQMPVSHHPIVLGAPRPKIPIPPPLFDLHGPAHPIVAGSEHPLHNDQLTTYRPTGPHLYDHLSSLPLDVFGHRSWFVLDKEEEIFELTDVLDEDKSMCALWGRWVLLNRPIFIKNYLAGVEAFVDEYWHMIHRAAGWGALRVWLMMLVSRRFLKNTEMVQILKRYNGLIGKNK